MRRSGLVFTILTVTVLSAPMLSYGQRTPLFTVGRALPTKVFPSSPSFPVVPYQVSPDVVTIWQRLGIPQGAERIRAFRDSRVNRDGLSPGKERKPPLLRLDHPAFLQEGSPELLKTAAKMKIDQDLAPQKIKALMYICQIGCSCYNKQFAGKVEEAVIEGLKDCSLSVRKAALNVILSNAGSACSCEGQCHTCCSDGVLKVLEEIAYKQDKQGCFIEPNAEIRNMAAQALNACPPRIVEPEPAEEKKEEKEEVVDVGDTAKASDGGDEDSGDDEDMDQEGPDADDTEEGDSAEEDGQTSSRTRRVRAQQTSVPASFGTAWSNPALSELNIRGVVRSLEPSEANVTIQLIRPLELPVGSQLVIALDENMVSFGNIVASRTGRATIRVEDFNLVNSLQSQRRVRLGVLE